MATTWYKRKWVIVLLHISVWTLLFLFPILFQKSIQDTRGGGAHKADNTLFLYLSFFTDLIWIALFYFNAFVLIPKLFYKRKMFLYTIIQLIMLTSLAMFHWLFLAFMNQHPFSLSGFLLFNTFPFLFILACSTAYRMIQDKIQSEQLQQARETETLKTELSFLRSQVNPHFMFNVLNNMVALARKKSDLLEPSLIQLSSLLRYMLYETDEDKVPLQKEVDYLGSYIDLQKQRFGEKLVVKTNVEICDEGYEIEPMLLIPFVENAFKHGTGLIEEPTIMIELKA
ncbi:MAG: histidine kinase, partial [Bacteroidota bacterium]|nr:histidine kinase [Bacteroidota bacterium]